MLIYMDDDDDDDDCDDDGNEDPNVWEPGECSR